MHSAMLAFFNYNKHVLSVGKTQTAGKTKKKESRKIQTMPCKTAKPGVPTKQIKQHWVGDTTFLTYLRTNSYKELDIGNQLQTELN